MTRDPGAGPWRWTFRTAAQAWGCPQLELESSGFESRAEAEAELTMLRKHLYDPGQPHPRPDPVRVRRLRGMLALWRTLGREVSACPYLAFAAEALRVLGEELAARFMDPPWCSLGFPNLGNTCYVNAVVQCLFHCTPFRRHLWGLAGGAGYVGACLRDLLKVYCDVGSTAVDTLGPLVRVVGRVLGHCGFAGGSQQDVAECLMHLLPSIDQGCCQRSVCGATGAPDAEGMTRFSAPTSLQARGPDSPTLSMADVLAGAVAEDCAARQAPPALLLRVADTYTQDDEPRAAMVAADWSSAEFRVSDFGDPRSCPCYRVTCFISHADAVAVAAPAHYIAYVRNGSRWFALNDTSVVALPGPPSAYPCLVFLQRLGPRGPGGATSTPSPAGRRGRRVPLSVPCSHEARGFGMLARVAWPGVGAASPRPAGSDRKRLRRGDETHLCSEGAMLDLLLSRALEEQQNTQPAAM